MRQPNRRPPRRGPNPWTRLEIALMIVSMLLIVFPVYAEAYRWVNPRIAPAAPRLQATGAPQDPGLPPTAVAATSAPAPGIQDIPTEKPTEKPADAPVPQFVPTNTPPPTAPPSDATNTPAPTSDATAAPTTVPTTGPTAAPTDVPTAGPSAVPTDVPTAGPSAVPTDVPTAGPSAVPTDVPTSGPTAVPTAGPSATTAPTVGPTGSPIPEPPLTVEKNASTASVAAGGSFSYSISVFSTSATNRSVTVTDDLDGQLEFVSASSTCSGTTRVTCTVNVRRNAPASIVITVRIRAGAAAGTRIANQANALDDQSNVAVSGRVVVTVSGAAAPGTAGPTNTPRPGEPTDVPAPTATDGPAATNFPTTVPGSTSQPTEEPRPTRRPGGGGGGDNRDEQTATPVGADIVLPPAPVDNGALPPPALPAAPPPARPAAPAVPGRPAPPQPPAATATPLPTATPDAPGLTATSVAAALAGLDFQMGADWGSAFPGQEVFYVVSIRNNRSAESQALSNVAFAAQMPDNLEIVRVTQDPSGNDPSVNGNTVGGRIGALKPGESVVIGITTRIKPSVAAGTRIVTQGALTYDGLVSPVRSNLVTLQVVGSTTPQPTATGAAVTGTAASLTQTPVPVGSAYPAPSGPAVNSVPGAQAGTAQPTPTAQAGAAAPPTKPTVGGALPETSAGIPLTGLALLGGTLAVRTVRLRRERTRI